MGQAMLFGEVLEAIDGLSPEEQETLIEILQRRIVEQERKRLAAEIQAARKEFAEGQGHSSSVGELMKEILS